MLQVPERIYVAGEYIVQLRGDFLAGMEYRALTGSSFEEAWDALRPQLLEHELAKAGVPPQRQEDAERVDKAWKPGEEREPLRVVSRDVWDTMFMDLFFSFAAGWRRDHRWDAKHRQDEDQDMEPRFRGPYVKFARLFPYAVLRKLRPVVFGLLSEALSDPSEADAEGTSDRPKEKPESPDP